MNSPAKRGLRNRATQSSDRTEPEPADTVPGRPWMVACRRFRARNSPHLPSDLRAAQASSRVRRLAITYLQVNLPPLGEGASELVSLTGVTLPIRWTSEAQPPGLLQGYLGHALLKTVTNLPGKDRETEGFVRSRSAGLHVADGCESRHRTP